MNTKLRHLLAGIALCALAPAWAQQSCGPPDGGPPSCDGGGPASQPDPDALAGAGNPINLINGNKYQREVDMPALPGVLGLEIVRHYNSALASERSPNGLLGRGWRLSYETELAVIGPTVQILQADGRRLIFNRDPSNPSLCAGNDPAQGTIGIESGAQGPAYTWRWPNGRQLHFNSRGQLLDIRAASGETLSLLRAPDGKLLRITDPQGRQLRLEYLDRTIAAKNDQFRGVQAIESPVGGFAYEHDDARSHQTLANLTSVLFPSADKTRPARRYHYEDSRFPSLLTGITQIIGSQATRLSRYVYDANGLAISSSHGSQSVTLDRHQGGVTLITDGAGQTTTFRHTVVAGQYRVLESRGAGCPGCGPANRRYGYDALGRRQTQTRLNDQGQPQETLKTTRDAQGRIEQIDGIADSNGRPQPAQPLAHYEYEGNPLRRLTITRPSVVPGQYFKTVLDYNERGQITRTTQSGYSPVIGQAPQAIARSTTYAYETVNSVSRLKQVDGPLPNGPKGDPSDSDVTLYGYGQNGNVVDIVRPLGRHRKPAGEGIEYLMHAAGLASDIESPQKAGDDPATSQLQPRELNGTPSPQLVWQDADGAAWLKAAYGLPGTAAARQMLAIESVRGTAYRLIDDFGRVVAVRNPEQGWQQAHYDAADHLIEITDPRGARQTIERDPAGRLQTLKRYAPGSEKPQAIITHRYKGERLAQESIEDVDGVRINAYTYDASGRLKDETLSLVAKGDLASLMPDRVRLRRHYRYDENGRRIVTELTDSRNQSVRLQQRYTQDGQIASIATGGLLPAWLGGSTTIIHDIAWQRLQAPGGRIDYAASLMHGNGIKEQWPIEQSGNQQVAPAAQTDEGPWAAENGAHDAAGLPQQLNDKTGVLRLHWNVAGQLAAVSRQTSPIARYLYDSRGRRVLKIISGQSPTAYFYEDTKLIAEADAKGNFSEIYSYLGYRPVAQLSLRQQGWIAALKHRLWGPEVRALQTRLAGRVIAMTDEHASPLWRDGEAAPSTVQPLRYIGQYHDEETGLDYHGARYFDPKAERFISPDSLGIADVLQGVPKTQLLDLYAYAGGDPDHYFDPNGAAKIHYYAITTDSDGNSMGTNSQGFANARWAFVIDDIKPTSDTSDLGQLQNQYSTTGVGMLIDVGGKFQGATGTFIWDITGHGLAPTTKSDFTQFYDKNLIDLPNFSVDMDDAAATYLIAYYAKDPAAQGSCPAFNVILPPIIFADEEEPINITLAASGDAKEQRIVDCGDASNDDVVDRRLQKYNYAAMLLESYPSQINKDCSKNGCPGNGLDGTALDGYVASYGKTQFVGMTMADTLLNMRENESEAEARKALKLDEPKLWGDKTGAVVVAMKGGEYVGDVFAAHTASTPDWSKVSVADQKAFMAGSGLDTTAAKKIWNDINAWKKNPTKNLNEEARNGIMTEVLFADPTVKEYLMGIFKDSRPNGGFDQVSLYLMRENYDKVAASGIVDDTNTEKKAGEDVSDGTAWMERQREIEIEYAARVARRHNGDSRKNKYTTTKSLKEMMDFDTKNKSYAHRFINVDAWPWTPPSDPTKMPPVANYFSLRCADSLPEGSVPHGGLQMEPLVLPSPD